MSLKKANAMEGGVIKMQKSHQNGGIPNDFVKNIALRWLLKDGWNITGSMTRNMEVR